MDGVTAPEIPLSVWILAALDPFLIAVAVTLGWKADQFGKVFIAAIAALGVSVLLSWLIHSVGLPWIAPVGRDLPTLYPVRAVAALLWAALAFGVRRTWGER